MTAKPMTVRSLALLIAMAMLPHVAFARDAAIAAYGTREWLRETLAYYRITDGVTTAELDKLLDLKSRVFAPGLDLKQRLMAGMDLYAELSRLMDGPPVSRQTEIVACVGLAFGAQSYGSGADQRALPAGATPIGSLGHVVKTGHGPVPMILIGDYGTAPWLYEGFGTRNADDYTMFIVTIPGFGGTPAPPRPETFDPDATPWFDGLERGVLELIDKEKLDRPFVVGTQAGAYLATRLAVEHPGKFRGAVVLNGLVYMSLRETRTTELNPSLSERRRLVARRPDLSGLMAEFLPPSVPTEAAVNRLLDSLPPPVQQFALGVNVRDPAVARSQFVDFFAHGDPRAGQYLVELNASDLTESLGRLKIPLLAVPSVPDDGSPAPDTPGLAQWNEVRVRYPSIPLTVAPLRDTRSYAVLDAPAEVDRAIASFVAGGPVRIERRHADTGRKSPRASATESIGPIEVAIEYGRPHLNGRDAKQLTAIQPGGVWRAGANEATRLTLTGDVLVEGQRLAAGAYGVFAIPGDAEWTLIFNRVADQWGAFSYNPEFDALRVKVVPQPADFREWLTWSFEPVSPTSARLVLAWDRSSVGVTISAGGNPASSP